MLGPDERETLLDLLEPPEGMSLASAVGTTYSLDLLALLAVPLGFAMARSTTDDETAGGEQTPTTMIDAVRKSARKISVFCQAGAIAVPSSTRSLMLAFLEKCVVPVTAPSKKGIFHPKVWVVQFCAPDGGTAHRVLVMSRNLTFDRSWDVVVALDEHPDGVKLPALGEFLRFLPGRAAGRLDSVHRDRVESLAAAVGRARFAIPEGFDGMTFRAGGLKQFGWRPFPTGVTKSLVVSPFLTRGCLDGIDVAWRDLQVVALAADIDRELQEFREDETLYAPRLWNISPDAIDVNDSKGAADDAMPTGTDPALSGLHAKVFVHDVGARTHAFVGSANATSAAFSQNVEVLIELKGPRRLVGVEKWISESNEPDTLRRLLIPHVFENAPEPTEVELLGDELEAFGRGIASQPVTLSARRLESDVVEVTYRTAAVSDRDPEVSIELRPITITTAKPWGDGKLEVAWELALAAVTRFLVLRLTKKGVVHELVVRCDATEFPEDRDAHVLAKMLQDPDRLVRYLLMLLSDVSVDRFTGEGQSILNTSRGGRATSLETFPLLEVMVRAIVRSPSALAEVDGLIRDLRESDALDPSLLELWTSVRTAAGMSGGHRS